MSRRLLTALLLGAVSMLSCATAAADALTPVEAKTVALPPGVSLADPATSPTFVAIDGTMLAIGRDGAAQGLAADASDWRVLRWASAEPPQGVLGTFGDATQAFLLLAPAADPTPPAVDSNTVAPYINTVASIERITLERDALARHPLPPLPSALQGLRATVRQGQVTVAGRDAGTGAFVFWRIDSTAPMPAWAAFAALPDAAAGSDLVALTAQGNNLIAITAESNAADPGATGVDTTGAGTQRAWRWTREDGWGARSTVPGRVLAHSGHAIGQAHMLFLLQGADGSTSVSTYQTITDAWAVLPGAVPGNATASLRWPEGIAWVGADTTGNPSLTTAQVQSRKHLLTWLDWVMIVVYLAAMVGIGLFFYLREKRSSTENFFVGNRTIPFWAAGLSLYAVNTSSISFIAIPAKAFESNWQYLTNNLIAVVGLMFVAVWVVPLLRRLDLMSTFSYLETRFHPGIRMMASGLAIVMQIGSRMSVILFLPALAIATITGISVVWSVLLMGGFTIVYTAMGGMKAVIWTDVVQVIVKMGGAIFAIGFIVWSLDKGVVGFVSEAMAQDKMKLLDFSFDLTKATVWGFVFLVLFEVVLTFPKDQVLMQRVLSTKSDRDAGRSIWAFALIMIPGGFVFYMIGTALFMFYKANPERMNPLLPIDATFPLFIAAELPMGVTGIIIAGILAAAMATLSGIMNSVATLISVDFYDRFAKEKSQKKAVFFAEMMTIVVGLVGIGAALILSRFDVQSLFDVSIELAGLLGGGFAGAYTLGMFTRRANSPGVAIGIGAAIVITFIAWSFDLVHPYFYLAISILVCVVVGYLASLLFPPPTRSLVGLTIYKD